MSDIFTEDQILEFKEAFNIFDRDGDGLIGPKELKSTMKSIDQDPTDEDIREMMNEVDFNGDGSIDFNEFLSLMALKCKETDEEDEIIECFEVFDKNNDGYITADDLRQMMAFWGEKITDQEAKDMLKRADEDEDGLINFEEFKKIMLIM